MRLDKDFIVARLYTIDYIRNLLYFFPPVCYSFQSNRCYCCCYYYYYYALIVVYGIIEFRFSTTLKIRFNIPINLNNLDVGIDIL